MVKLFRKRYIAFRLMPPVITSKRELFALFVKRIRETQDQNTLDNIHLRIVNYNPNVGLGIVRCDHRAVHALSFALNSITEITHKFNVETLWVSGTIKALKRKISISYLKRTLNRQPKHH